MKFTQLKSTPTAENLNNRVAQMFGSKIKLESFTTEQLTAARDKLANQLQVIENQANFDAIHTSEAYQKNRLFLKVIEQKIAELQITPSDNAAVQEQDDESAAYEIEYEYTGDDGYEAPGQLHYKVVNGKVDPKSLRAVLNREYDGNHRLSNDDASEQVQPGGDEHENALTAAQEDYNEEHNRLRLKAMAGQESAAAEDAVDVAMKGMKPIKFIQIEYEIIGTIQDMMHQGGSYEKVMDKIEDFITNEIGQQYVDKGIDIVKQAIQNKDEEMTFDDMINQIKSTGESTDTVDETMTRQHFQYVADMLKNIEDVTKRGEYAQHHSAIFQHFNPNFDHEKFMQAAGVYTVTKGKEDNKSAESVAEAKPDFLDMDKDGDKKEPMKKAIKDKEKKKDIKEAAEDTAKIVMAANSMVDKITGWLEDTAKMQTEVNLDLGDEIRNEMGSEKAEEFIAAMKPAIEQLYTQLETVRKSFTGGVAVLTGEEAPATLGAEDPKDDIEDLETEVEPEVTPDTADDFTASEPATGGEEPADRKKRESIIRRSPKLAEMLSRPFIGKKKV